MTSPHFLFLLHFGNKLLIPIFPSGASSARIQFWWGVSWLWLLFECCFKDHLHPLSSIYCWEEFDQRRSPNLSWCLFCLLCFYLKCLLKLFWSFCRLTLPRPVLLDPCDWKHKFLVLAFISLTDFSEHFFFIKVSLIMERVWLFFWQFRIDVN